jgi:hypothetical protein
VYRSVSDPSSGYQLYGVRSTGGPIVQLSPASLAHWSVTDAEISSDSTRVVYRALDANNVFELFVVPIGGGTAVQLSPEFKSGL